MTVAFHQPNFLPNLAFFYKMAVADVFVVVTNLQFEKGEGWQRRHKIKTLHGDQWLTVPVIGSQNQLIKDVKIYNTFAWQRKHYHALKYTYGQTPEPELLARIFAIYQQPWERLVDLNMALIMLLKDTLDIQTRVVLDEKVGGQKHHLITNICRKYHANVYLSGQGGKHYMTADHHAALARHGVTCRFIERNLYQPYPYSSLHYVLTLGRQAVINILCD